MNAPKPNNEKVSYQELALELEASQDDPARFEWVSAVGVMRLHEHAQNLLATSSDPKNDYNLAYEIAANALASGIRPEFKTYFAKTAERLLGAVALSDEPLGPNAEFIKDMLNYYLVPEEAEEIPLLAEAGNDAEDDAYEPDDEAIEEIKEQMVDASDELMERYRENAKAGVHQIRIHHNNAQAELKKSLSRKALRDDYQRALASLEESDFARFRAIVDANFIHVPEARLSILEVGDRFVSNSILRHIAQGNFKMAYGLVDNYYSEYQAQQERVALVDYFALQEAVSKMKSGNYAAARSIVYSVSEHSSAEDFKQVLAPFVLDQARQAVEDDEEEDAAELIEYFFEGQAIKRKLKRALSIDY